MYLDQFKLFKVLSTQMSWLQSRQRVLAENVANADTPKFRAKDIKPLSFVSNLSNVSSSIEMRKTHANHLSAGNRDIDIKIEIERQDFRSNATGNNVILEEEMMKSAQTSADYQLATSLYKKSVGLFRLAISKR